MKTISRVFLICLLLAKPLYASNETKHKNVSTLIIDRTTGESYNYNINPPNVLLHSNLRISVYQCVETINNEGYSIKAVHALLSDTQVPTFNGWLFVNRPSLSVWNHPRYTVVFRNCF